MNQCSYCNAKHLYKLANGYVKCAKCKRKQSPKRYERIVSLTHAFCLNKNALQTSKDLNLNYITVYKHYQLCRKLITSFLDQLNKEQTIQSNEYDEYIYMKNDNIYTAQNFLTFVYGHEVYNLMLPSLYKFRTYSKSEEELSKFLFLNKIAKIESKNGVISEFWKFLEDFLKKYKGVNSSNFIYYLKEAEFKFNYEPKAQKEILLKLFIQ